MFELNELREAVSMHASRAGEKLRQQNSVARYISVFLKTNKYKDGPQYNNSMGTYLPEPTSYTPDFIKTAHMLLDNLYKPGYRYKKAGVMLAEICPDNAVQLNLFYTSRNLAGHMEIMDAMDEINMVWGRDTIKYASSGIKKPWAMKRNMVSPRYTTTGTNFQSQRHHNKEINMKKSIWIPLLILSLFTAGCGTATKAYRVVDPRDINKQSLSKTKAYYTSKYKIPYAKTKGVDHSEEFWDQFIDEKWTAYSSCVKIKIEKRPPA